MIIVDKLCYLSKLRYVNPGEKFAFAMLTLLFCIVSRSIVMGIAVLLVNGFITIALGGISPRRYLNLMLVPLAFLVLSTVAIIVNISKSPLDAFAIGLGDFYITGSRASILKGIQLIVTALASVSCLYFLSLNTTMTDILSVFRKLHCPKLMCELMLLIYRYIFILLDFSYYITTAQKARLGYNGYKSSLRDFAAMLQAMFVRAINRSNNLYNAMEARCYDGEIQVLDENIPPSAKHIIFIVIFETILCAATVYIKIRG